MYGYMRLHNFCPPHNFPLYQLVQKRLVRYGLLHAQCVSFRYGSETTLVLQIRLVLIATMLGFQPCVKIKTCVGVRNICWCYVGIVGFQYGWFFVAVGFMRSWFARQSIRSRINKCFCSHIFYILKHSEQFKLLHLIYT